MRRHATLIPFSKQHHQMLVLAQLLKADVPDYEGLPTTTEGKCEYLLKKFDEVILPNFNKHRKLLYPAIIQWGFQGEELLEQIQQLEDNVLLTCKSIKDGGAVDDMKLNELGYALDELVRTKERELYQNIQARFSVELVDLQF